MVSHYEIGGPVANKVISKIASRVGSRTASDVVDRALNDVVEKAPRGARNPEVAEKLAEGRAKHAQFAQKVKSKPGWRSEPSMTDPFNGKTVKLDAVTPSGRLVELKPKSPSGRAQGRRQLPAQERATGKKGRVVYYEPKNE